LVEGRFW